MRRAQNKLLPLEGDTVNFIDDVKDERKLTSTGCGMRKWLNTQTEITDQALKEAVTEVNASATHRALQKRGFTLGVGVVAKHANGDCSCRTS